MPEDKKKTPLVRWQTPMRRVLIALVPALLAAIYFFGWRCLIMLIVVNVFAFLSEYAFCKYYKEPVTSAVFVTGTLFTLILPPNLPYWMAVAGIVFGVVFGKMVFGGFGKNVFNPALVGRAFIYVNFSTPMTAGWFMPNYGKWAGIIKYSTDAVSGATPMQVMKAGKSMGLFDLFIGNTSGCMGETCALALILGGVYLLWTKTANYRLIAGTLIGFVVLQGILWLSGVNGACDPLRGAISGGFMLGAIYMVTDPVSACKTNPGRWIYGTMIGALTVVIRMFSVWAEGMMFAILLGNMFAPITDYAVNAIKRKRKGG